MKKIEHIGIAVKDMQAATQIYSALLGYTHYKTEEVSGEGVNTTFFVCGDSKIELLEATNQDSAIAKFIAKKGEGVHHIAFAVDDINIEVQKGLKFSMIYSKNNFILDEYNNKFILTANNIEDIDTIDKLRIVIYWKNGDVSKISLSVFYNTTKN